MKGEIKVSYRNQKTSMKRWALKDDKDTDKTRVQGLGLHLWGQGDKITVRSMVRRKGIRESCE